MSAQVRLQKEYISIQKDPIPYAYAVPDPNNWLDWHFLIHSLSGAFEGGTYYGLLQFPSSYPSAPPSMKLMTPNGRFTPDTNICTTMSNYHPEEWSPAWNARSIITGLISFMFSSEGSVGTCNTNEKEKKRLAALSKEWNLTNSRFLNVFADYLDEIYPDNREANRGISKKSKIVQRIKENAFPIGIGLLLAAFYIIKQASKV